LLFPTWLVMRINCPSTGFFLAILVGTNDKTPPNDKHLYNPNPAPTHHQLDVQIRPLESEQFTLVKWFQEHVKGA
jgi:hypothetical protein